LGENCLLHENLPRVSEEDRQRLSKYVLREGDIVFSRVGSVDRRAYVNKGEDGWLFSGRCLRVRPISEELDSRYLSYYFGLNSFKEYIRAIAVGSTMPSLNTTILSDIEIPLPPIFIQRRIAAILSVLDEKIELNRQTNATLEAIAQTIFKEWFVDFRFPGATGEMQDSNLGPIPKGWKVGKIKDCAIKIQYGLTQSSSSKEVGPHFLRITDIQHGKINWDSVPYCIVDENEFQKYRIDSYDVVIARTGASTGESALVINPPRAVFASYLIRLQFEKVPTAIYVGKLLRTNQYLEFIDSIKSGSAQPNANAQQLSDLIIVIPADEVLVKYFKIVGEIESYKTESQNQSATLARIRDNLLPKLLLGKICVKEVEQR
jgi:type I restriction enzyme, S subunit